MAIAWTELTEGFSASNPGVTASISPTADRWVFVAVATSSTEGPHAGEVDISGCGITWAKVSEIDFGGRRTVHVFRGMNASPTTGALTITWTDDGGSGAYEQMKWSVDEASGVHATVPVGTAYTTASSGETMAVTVSETPDSGDHVYAAMALEDNNATTLNGELATKLSDFGDATGARHLTVAYDDTPDSSPTPGMSWTGSTSYGGIAFIVETAGDVGGGSVVPQAMMMYRRMRA